VVEYRLITLELEGLGTRKENRKKLQLFEYHFIKLIAVDCFRRD
jgi:hypothetical protein